MKNLSYIYTIIHTLFLLCLNLFSAKAQEPVTIAFFSTTNSTAGLCAPAPVEFQIGNWFNNSPGTTYVIDFGDGSPNITLPHPLNATNTTYLLSHIYSKSSCPNIDFRATLKVINGVYTTTYTLDQIMVRQKPVVDFGVPPTCTNIPVCFTNQTKNAFTDNSCSITGNFTWDFGDGTTSNAVNPPCHTYTVAGTYDVTLKVSSTACGDDSKTKQITVGPLSPSPVVTTPVLYCQGQSVVPLNATGTALLWYTSATGGVGSATAPTPSTTTAGTKTYYVSQTLPGYCESLRVPVTVTVYALPSKPVVTTPVNLCLNQLAVPLTATGTALLWYTNATGGVGSSIAPTPSTTNVGNTIYYVSQSNSYGCESPLANIGVNVYPVPSKPSISTKTSLCVGEDLILQASSSIEGNALLNYLWKGPGIDFPANASNVGITGIEMKDAGVYTITVSAPPIGCSAEAGTIIKITDCRHPQILVPNAFAPAGNVPENRRLIVRASGIRAVRSFRVFNRWGKIVFERNNFPPNIPEFGWDGQLNGKPADAGVYVYTVDVVYENGVPYSFRGNVTLL